MAKDYGFDFRWGIPELDDKGYIEIPGFIKRNYAKLGVKPAEMMCIGHLSSYKYDSPKGEAQPSLATIAQEMGYSKSDPVRRMVRKLEKDNLLSVERIPGKPSTYNFGNLARGCLALEQGSPEMGTPQTRETSTPQTGGTVPLKRGDEDLEEIQKKEPTTAPKKPREPNPLFDQVASRLFNAHPGSDQVKAVGGRVGKAMKALGEIDATLMEFIRACDWWKGQGLSLPRDSEKVASMVLDYRAAHQQQKQSSEQTYWSGQSRQEIIDQLKEQTPT